MGLDMYAFKTFTKIPKTDFDPPEDSQELSYWRKHPNLHGWMEKLYLKKRGWFKGPSDFNTATVRIDAADLDDLEEVVKADRLPLTTGFFFGKSRPEEKGDDVEFIAKARKAIADGQYVFYTSWW